jgi:elongation factor P--(R)-beta-lysine ligase
MLEQRATLLARTRRFFADGGVLEVDTPIVVNAPVTDVHIHSARVDLEVNSSTQPRSSQDAITRTTRPYFLHTSPEYAMKRLLAAGSGDIYQICHVMRGFERGRLHNAEFTLVEWYRVGFTLEDLMSEVDALVRALLGPVATGRTSEHITYGEVFRRQLQLDPFDATLSELQSAATQRGFQFQDTHPSDGGSATSATPAPQAGMTTAPGSGDPGHSQRDELLEFLMGSVIGPQLGAHALTFVHSYPASQAALARLDPHDPRAALRFELYCDGIELANGFHELASESEQRARFERDLEERRRAHLPTFPPDELLLAALASGLPECSGVALGFDRTLMIATGAQAIDEVLPFPTDRA